MKRLEIQLDSGGTSRTCWSELDFRVACCFLAGVTDLYGTDLPGLDDEGLGS